MTIVEELSSYLNYICVLDEPYRGHTAVYIEGHPTDLEYGCMLGEIGVDGFKGSREYFTYVGLGVCTEELMKSRPILNKKPVINRQRKIDERGFVGRYVDSNLRHKPPREPHKKEKK